MVSNAAVAVSDRRAVNSRSRQGVLTFPRASKLRPHERPLTEGANRTPDPLLPFAIVKTDHWRVGVTISSVPRGCGDPFNARVVPLDKPGSRIGRTSERRGPLRRPWVTGLREDRWRAPAGAARKACAKQRLFLGAWPA